jgi:hypothetical protein
VKRLASVAYWAAPSLLCLLLYWLGLKAWFQQDDFAWLSQNRALREGGGLWTLLFMPMAQGTIRPLSERAFFLVFGGLFGLSALPFRIAVFLTQMANLALISSIARRLTRSRAAGFLAPCLWIANGVLATVMSWTAAYNEVLCAFFLLASFWLLLKYVATGQRRYCVWQWAAFLIGLGALELIVVYPAIAVCYTFLLARDHLRRTLWLLVPSAAYAAIHWHFAPQLTTGPYRMHLTSRMLETLWTYWQWALSPARLVQAGITLRPAELLTATLALTVGLVGFAVIQFRIRNRLGVFLLLWFLILIAPVLPLRDHITDYYLTMPTIGLAMLGGWALAQAWRRQWYNRAIAVALAAVYLLCSVPVARATTRWQYNRSRAVKTFLTRLARVHELHPDKMVLLTGVSNEQFWAAIADKGYRLVGIEELYLAPGSEAAIQPYEGNTSIADFVLAPAVTMNVIDRELAVVYDVGGRTPRAVTSAYRQTMRSRFPVLAAPSRVDAGSASFEGQLGPGWYNLEGSFRWMAKRASVSLRGPRTDAERLYVSGSCPAQLVRAGPLKLSLSVDGVPVGSSLLTKPDSAFELSFPLPAQAAGKPSVEVTVEVSRAFSFAGDNRELGLAFGVFAIR